MKILVTGSTGLVGSALIPALVRDGHTICRLIRPGTKAHGEVAGGFDVHWNPETGELGGAAVGAEAVVNLAGASVAEGRWTEKRKALLRSSRVDATRALAGALGKMNAKPAVLISASATGYYGNRGDETLTEESATGDGFLAELARDWEAEATKAEAFRTRVVLARFGVVLARSGGALAKMATPFRLGLGGKLGNGTQWMPWIALDDVVGILQLCLSNTPITGAVSFSPPRGPMNVVSPQPATNAEFTKTLAEVLHRPAVLPAPRFALRMAFGEMADEALLTSERVVPKKLNELSYRFRYPDLRDALRELLAA